jgi:hypothetical protein
MDKWTVPQWVDWKDSQKEILRAERTGSEKADSKGILWVEKMDS